MTGPQIKAAIIAYLESCGWTNLHPGEVLAWLDPSKDGILKLYTWYAAFVVELSRETRGKESLPFIVRDELVPDPEFSNPEFPGSAA